MGPTLETERLILRPPLAQDLDAWADFVVDPAVMRFLGGEQPREAAWRQLTCMVGA